MKFPAASKALFRASKAALPFVWLLDVGGERWVARGAPGSGRPAWLVLLAALAPYRRAARAARSRWRPGGLRGDRSGRGETGRVRPREKNARLGAAHPGRSQPTGRLDTISGDARLACCSARSSRRRCWSDRRSPPGSSVGNCRRCESSLPGPVQARGRQLGRRHCRRWDAANRRARASSVARRCSLSCGYVRWR